MRHKPQHIYNDIFRVNFYVSNGVSREEYVKAAKRITGKDFEIPFDRCKGRCSSVYLSEKKSTIIWIWIRDEGDLETLVHECMHAVFYACEYKITLNDSTDEVYARMMEMLIKRILRR